MLSGMDMPYCRLGRSGLPASAPSATPASRATAWPARGAGVNFFANADAHAAGASEGIMGAAITELGWERADHVIPTVVESMAAVDVLAQLTPELLGEIDDLTKRP